MKLTEGYYSSPRWSWEILDCAMPMTFDTYSNCAHQCLYCFSFFQRAVGGGADDYLHHKVRPVNVEKIKRMFTDPDEHAGTFAWYIKNKMVLQWGGLSDGFDWYERKFRLSLELLRFFREIDYPLSISTKGVWFVDDPEYVEAFTGARNVQMKYSIITTNEEHARKLEAGTPTPEERFRALERLKAMGVGVVTTRFRPYVLGVSDICVEDIFARSAAAGVDSITTEFLCIESRSSTTAKERYRLIGDITGHSLLKFYRQNSSAGAGLLRLNYDLKRPHFEKMEALAEQYDIPFYVSDAHHKERSAGTGCCGLPDNAGPLSNINRGQYSEAIQIAKDEGSVRWSQIAPLAEGLKNIPFSRAPGYNVGTTQNKAQRRYLTMFDFMHQVWNDPRNAQSPARYFGGAMVPGSVDDQGDIIYLYNEPFVTEGIRVKSVAELTERLATQADESRADGREFGHVAYPVYVLLEPDDDPAKVPALKQLDAARLPVTAFCSAPTVPLLERQYQSVDIIPYNDGLTKAGRRQAMLNYAREQEVAAVWIVDAAVDGFYSRGDNGRPQQTSPRAVLSGVEALAEHYEHIAMAGPGRRSANGSEFIPNTVVARCFLLRTDTELNFDGTVAGLQDTDLCLQHLDEGWNTVKSEEFTIGTGPERAGGAVDAHMAQRWELYADLDEDFRLRVHWDLFNHPLRPKALAAVLEGAV